MSDLASLNIQIKTSGHDQAVNNINNVKRSGMEAQNNLKGMNNINFSSLIRNIAMITAAWMSVHGAIRAVTNALQTIDKFKTAVIGISSALTDLAKPGQGSFEKIFAQNTKYAQQMYRAINVEATKHFSSASEMMMSYNRLVQSGYAVRMDEVGALGLLTDKIKLATAGQNTEMQINQEIRALMQGQQMHGALIARDLESKLGPGWGKLVEQHKRAGDLLQWIASLYPGLQAANETIQKTIDSQYSTMKSLVELITIGGLTTAYNDVVDLLIRANDYLREHQDTIENGLIKAWQGVKELVMTTLQFIKDIYAIVSVPVNWVINVVGAGAALLTGSTATGGKYKVAGDWMLGIKETEVTIPPVTDYGMGYMQSQNLSDIPKAKITNPAETAALQAAYGNAKLVRTTEGIMPIYGEEAIKPIAIKPGAGGGGKGKGGGGGGDSDSATRQLENFIQTMNSLMAKASGDSYAAIGEWYNKQTMALQRIEEKTGASETARTALKSANTAQIEKIDRAYNEWYAKETGDRYLGEQNKMQENLDKWGNTEQRRVQIREIGAAQLKQIDLQYNSASLNAQKEALSAMAGATPYLSDQLQYQKEILKIESQLAEMEIQRKVLSGDITENMADQQRAYQAMIDQAKEYKFTMENDKGFKGWAFSRGKEADQRNTIKDLLSGAESWMGNTFATSAVDALTGKKTDLQELFNNVMNEAIQWVFKTNVQTLMDFGAKALSPKQESGMGNLSSIKMPKQTSIEKKIDQTEFKNLKLEGKQIKLFDREIKDFDRSIKGLGEFANTGQETYGMFSDKIDQSFPALAEASLKLQGTVTPVTGAAQQNLQAANTSTFASQASTLSSYAAIGAAAGMGLAAIGMLTGSKELSMAGMVISTAAALLQTAAMIMMAAEWSPFHSGGVVAHKGYYVAHEGLMLDERMVKAQVGEGIIKRDTMSAYARRGISFDMLNNGQVGAGGGSSVVNSNNVTYAPVVNAIDAKGVDKVLEKHGRVMVKTIKKEAYRGRKF
jgi:hypothetical protein